MCSSSSRVPAFAMGNPAAVSIAAQKPNTISVQGFKITTEKRPILKAEPIDDMTKRLGIAPPEMIFGDNFVTIQHEKSRWEINFNAYDALDRVDKTGASMLKVAYSKEWQRSREKTHEGIKEVVKPFDWSYTTDYTGTVQANGRSFEPTTRSIPLELLKRPDPILFFDEVILYEDELADNGITMLSCKIRVMPARLLLLSRFFLRLDNVLFRLRDTRVYIDFENLEVIREFQSKELDYETVRQTLATTRDDVPAAMRDPNRLSEILPLREKRLERVTLGD
ncbi:TIP41-like family-domain-containing protein [Aspergillus pseudonomiae]|uniref:TIP41-like family-domain-containing protein n=1 Tax=Aspergillus pseudonomiae TaxID=1506151 RepID=A0A5N6HR73_9EURO|nr:TIP41-like family-domain-containing protein [Aspergillus pseudonomiae]KAB8255890.1 TIP41-like family-domain-containing protein [Aspergillus pseudonomiae]KAE8398337.1 TIP41-like family-domain-containing protein [Aspergillus pseudonomiae]